MIRTLLFAAAISIFLFSCSKNAPPLSKQEMSKKVDSAVKASVRHSDEAARIDLERRLKIEVKVKVDSLVNAQRRANPAPAPATPEF